MALPHGTVTLVLVVLFLSAAVYARNTRFEKFFGNYNDQLTDTRDNACGSIWARERAPHAVYDEVCYDMLNCMLANTSEVIKSNFGSGVVALGLIPTILTFVSSSPGETALLSRRRPLLAALCAIGCPAVNPIPTFEYPDPVSDLREREGSLAPKWLAGPWSRPVVVLQYILVVGATVNVLWTSYDASLRSISALSCASTYLTVLWAGLTIVIHAIGVSCLALRYRTVKAPVSAGRGVSTGFRQWLKHEFSTCISHEKLMLQQKREGYRFVCLSWLGSLGTVSHLIFGTLAFSSLQFVGTIDATLILIKYMVSACICRVTLMSELAGMRNALDTGVDLGGQYGSSHELKDGQETNYFPVKGQLPAEPTAYLQPVEATRRSWTTHDVMHGI